MKKKIMQLKFRNNFFIEHICFYSRHLCDASHTAVIEPLKIRKGDIVEVYIVTK